MQILFEYYTRCENIIKYVLHSNVYIGIIFIKGGEHMLYTAPEIAVIAKVHIDTVRRWIRSGKLNAVRFGKEYRITEEELQAFLKRGY